MTGFLHGVESFFDHLAAVHWQYLALAVVCQVLRMGFVSRAWFNVLRASYGGEGIRWRHIYGAYVAGVGVNAIIPARVGDLAKLYIAKRRVPGATYTTLASTQVALTVFDFGAATLLMLWALAAGVFPGLSLLPSLPNGDWVIHNYKLLANVLLVVFVAALLTIVVAAHRIQDFWDRVALGFAAFRDRSFYFNRVAVWQAADWTLRFVEIYFFLRAFGIPASFHDVLLVQATQSLMTVFPFTPSGAGTEQALLIYALGGQASKAALVAFAVGSKITVVVVNVAVGFTAIGLMLRTFRWRRAAEADRAAEAEAGATPAHEPAPAGDIRPP